jgi:hypothetical protein
MNSTVTTIQVRGYGAIGLVAAREVAAMVKEFDGIAENKVPEKSTADRKRDLKWSIATILERTPNKALNIARHIGKVVTKIDGKQ